MTTCAFCDAPPMDDSRYCAACREAMRETFRAALQVLADAFNAQKATAALDAA